MEFSSIKNSGTIILIFKDVANVCSKYKVNFVYYLEDIRDVMVIKFEKGTLKLKFELDANVFTSLSASFIPKILGMVSSFYGIPRSDWGIL